MQGDQEVVGGGQNRMPFRGQGKHLRQRDMIFEKRKDRMSGVEVCRDCRLVGHETKFETKKDYGKYREDRVNVFLEELANKRNRPEGRGKLDREDDLGMGTMKER